MVRCYNRQRLNILPITKGCILQPFFDPKNALNDRELKLLNKYSN